MASIRRSSVTDTSPISDIRVAEIAVFERDEGVEPAWRYGSCWLRSRSRWSMRCSTPLDMTVEDRGVGRDAQPVRRLVHAEPFGRRPLLGTDPRRGSRSSKISAPPPGMASIPARFAQPSQPLLRATAPARRIMYDSSIAVKALTGVSGRYVGLHAADHLGVVVQPVVGVHARPRYALR